MDMALVGMDQALFIVEQYQKLAENNQSVIYNEFLDHPSMSNRIS